jgi:Xaa-Pro aminopeptidase
MGLTDNCDRLTQYGVDCLLVNSTDEFLSEYVPDNACRELTGFTGSVGNALLTRDNCFLFVDGRYHIQAEQEAKPGVTVVKLQTGQKFIDELLARADGVLGVNAATTSQDFVEKLGKNVQLILPETSLFPLPSSLFPLDLDGRLFLGNPEEVSYILNERDFSQKYSCAVRKKIIIGEGDKIYADKTTTTAADWQGVNELGKVIHINSPIKKMKAVKTEAEIAHYKDAFARTDETMRAIREYILNNDVTEHDVAVRLEQEFYKHGAKSLSFKPIVAAGKNSALAHYSKSSPDVPVKDLVLIDCGAYYESGLATDITRVFVKGEPTKLHRQVYTKVLKAFLHAFNFTEKFIRDNPAHLPSGFEIDAVARGQIEFEGWNFNHGLGHGIGISVHEYPPSLSCSELAKVPIEENMCFTIEPGLYNKEHFGVRLENACYMRDGKIHSFTNMNFEQKLIDYGMLNKQEQEWLSKFPV